MQTGSGSDRRIQLADSLLGHAEVWVQWPALLLATFALWKRAVDAILRVRVHLAPPRAEPLRKGAAALQERGRDRQLRVATDEALQRLVESNQDRDVLRKRLEDAMRHLASLEQRSSAEALELARLTAENEDLRNQVLALTRSEVAITVDQMAITVGQMEKDLFAWDEPQLSPLVGDEPGDARGLEVHSSACARVARAADVLRSSVLEQQLTRKYLASDGDLEDGRLCAFCGGCAAARGLAPDGHEQTLYRAAWASWTFLRRRSVQNAAWSEAQLIIGRRATCRLTLACWRLHSRHCRLMRERCADLLYSSRRT